MPVATIQAVTAVPTLAPSSTICAMRGTTRSRSTKEAIISAVAVELCSATVATKPETKERHAASRAAGKTGPQLGAEGARHTILHLRQAEQQQCHRAEQIDHDDGGFHFVFLYLSHAAMFSTSIGNRRKTTEKARISALESVW